ncbi:uroporphyrinogen-III synthase [Nitratiruptor sp. YY08-26]|uniref:uroporphyrinogen-III synthase n=1 Tax=unclassified Nitratiruptor TaxID=2624044 RepID=UPI0019168341|nr:MULTISPECIES: uroporphyrinogen-III synthase [unclassified Nitratiruptor]BCD62662.1 uroporphyrinogen-III synthase [Nitratiruptor sp. YY08-13]BCD66598.1 uroporphyrinogen-III synthase [Nitratiruptor sp. YY08-26]
MSIYILSDSDVEGAKKLPLIKQIPLVSSIEVDGFDYLIFTSKNSVKIINYFNPLWKKIPALAIGKATSKTIEQLGGKVIYKAKSFYGEDFAKEIAQKFDKNGRFLLVRGKKSLSDIKGILSQHGFSIDEKIIYQTVCEECKSLDKPEKGATIIFSSPSTIECFFRCFTWDPSYQAAVIGTKTAAYMPADISYKLFSQKSLQEIVDIIGNS